MNRKHYGEKISKQKSLQHFQDTADTLVMMARDWMDEEAKLRKIGRVHCMCNLFVGRDTVRLQFYFYHFITPEISVRRFEDWAKLHFPYEVIRSDFDADKVLVYLLGPSTKSIYW